MWLAFLFGGAITLGCGLGETDPRQRRQWLTWALIMLVITSILII